MSGVEMLAVGAAVAVAALYLGLRVRRVLRGGTCGCGVPAGRGCPAAQRVAADLERLARRTDAPR